MALLPRGSVAQITQFISHIASGVGLTTAMLPMALQLLVFGSLLFSVEAWVQNADDPRTRPLWRTALAPAVVALMFAAMILFAPQGSQTFLYFQF